MKRENEELEKELIELKDYLLIHHPDILKNYYNARLQVKWQTLGYVMARELREKIKNPFNF